MTLHGSKLLGLGFATMLILSSSCMAQDEIHLTPSTKMKLDAERFAFKINVMGTGNPAVIHPFASEDLMAVFVVINGNEPKRFMAGPNVSKTIKEPDQTVPCGDTTANITFYLGLDGKNTRALFINLEPGDGVLLDCEISGQVEAIQLQ
jgi:hypothetical protein